MSKYFLFVFFVLIVLVLCSVIFFNKFNKKDTSLNLFVINLDKDSWCLGGSHKKIVSFFYENFFDNSLEEKKIVLGFIGLDGCSLSKIHNILSFYYNLFVKHGMLNISIIPHFDLNKFEKIESKAIGYYLSLGEKFIDKFKRFIHFDLNIQSTINNLNISNYDFKNLLDNNYYNNKICFNYDSVIVGGTFDRLHAGHKLLLTMAYLSSKKTTLIKVTSNPLFFKNKRYGKLVTNYGNRYKSISNFMKLINNRFIIIDIDELKVPFPYDNKIEDIDKKLINIDAIVVSKETENSAIKINEKRLRLNLKKMDIIVVDYVGSVSKSNDFKLSSSFLREKEIRCR